MSHGEVCCQLKSAGNGGAELVEVRGVRGRQREAGGARVPAALSSSGICGRSAARVATAGGAAGVSVSAVPARLRLVRFALSAPALPSVTTHRPPLVGSSDQCARAMVQCESCWALVPSVEQAPPGSDGRTDSDGVSACRRCGFLSVERASVRALLQLPPRRDANGSVRLLLPASR
jgi:hypothetical protein